jgi:hypothetical protein
VASDAPLGLVDGQGVALIDTIVPVVLGTNGVFYGIDPIVGTIWAVARIADSRGLEIQAIRKGGIPLSWAALRMTGTAGIEADLGSAGVGEMSQVRIAVQGPVVFGVVARLSVFRPNRISHQGRGADDDHKRDS